MAWAATLLAAAARSATCRRGRRRIHSSSHADADPPLPGELLLSHLSSQIPPSPASPPSGASPRRRRPRQYNLLMKSFARAGRTNDVLRLFYDMRRRCPPTLACYTTLINALVLAGRPHAAEAFFDEMLSSGIAPDAAAYTVMVKLYACHLHSFDIAHQIPRLMERRGCHPDVVTYSTLIAGLCRAGRTAEAWGVLDSMLEDGRCSPNAHTYTPILQSYCADGQIRAAKRLLDSMHCTGCPPDAVAYNILVHALCRAGRFDDVENVIRDSPTKGWDPDSVTYNTYINGLCKAGRPEQAIEQLEVMLGKGLRPTTVTLNILLDRLCWDSRVCDVKLLLERSGELGLDFDVVSYNTVMCRLCQTGNWAAVLQLFTNMMKKGVTPDNHTFNIVINSLCKAGELDRAKCICESKGFVADIVTYNTLIHGFHIAGRVKELHVLFTAMDVRKIVPDTVTCNTVVDLLCRYRSSLDAVEFVRSLKDGVSQDLIAHLAHWLIMDGKVGELLSLFEEMSGKGVVLDGRVFEYVIKAFCKKGSCGTVEAVELYKVCLVLEKMLGIG